MSMYFSGSASGRGATHPGLEPLVLHLCPSPCATDVDGSQTAKEADAGKVPAPANLRWAPC